MAVRNLDDTFRRHLSRPPWLETIFTGQGTSEVRLPRTLRFLRTHWVSWTALWPRIDQTPLTFTKRFSRACPKSPHVREEVLAAEVYGELPRSSSDAGPLRDLLPAAVARG